jgi:hypothetical protein
VHAVTRELSRIIEQAAVPRISSADVLRVDGLASISEDEQRTAAKAIEAALFGGYPRWSPAT